MQVTQIATELNVGGDAAGGTMTLSDRMSHALANSYVSAGEDLGRLQAASSNADTATSPAALIELQLNLANSPTPCCCGAVPKCSRWRRSYRPGSRPG